MKSNSSHRTNDDRKNTGITLPYLDDFLLYLQTNNFSPETVYNYERDLETFSGFLNYDGQIEFGSTTKTVIERYKAYLNSVDRMTPHSSNASHRLSSSSINRMLSSLRRYLRYLIDMDHPVPIAPEAIRLTKMPRKHPRVAELSELRELIESPTKLEKKREIALRNRAILETFFSTGMRLSELISLNRNQVDKRGRILIRGKGKKERFVYLTDRAKNHIRAYLEMRNDDLLALFVPYRGRNAKTTKARISSNYVQMKLKQYRERLGINIPITPHTLRHGFATYLAEEGANPAAIQVLLGHESLQTTTRYVNTSDRYAEKTHKQFHPLKG